MSGDFPRVMTAVSFVRVIGAVALGASLTACSMGGLFGGGAPSPTTTALQNTIATPDEVAAMSPALPAIATECPPIKVRPGAEAVYYYGKGKVGNPNDLQWQAVIDKQSRNCVVSANQITIKMGVVGRLMLGPSGNQTSVDLPVRFAVESNGTALFTEKYTVPVALSAGAQAGDFVKVVDNLVIPYVGGEDIVIWVGFDSAKG
jgi:hypothetical protein